MPAGEAEDECCHNIIDEGHCPVFLEAQPEGEGNISKLLQRGSGARNQPLPLPQRSLLSRRTSVPQRPARVFCLGRASVPHRAGDRTVLQNNSEWEERKVLSLSHWLWFLGNQVVSGILDGQWSDHPASRHAIATPASHLEYSQPSRARCLISAEEHPRVKHAGKRQWVYLSPKGAESSINLHGWDKEAWGIATEVGRGLVFKEKDSLTDRIVSGKGRQDEVRVEQARRNNQPPQTQNWGLQGEARGRTQECIRVLRSAESSNWG